MTRIGINRYPLDWDMLNKREHNPKPLNLLENSWDVLRLGPLALFFLGIA